MATRYFTPKLFGFLRDLEANNDRAWFKANQERYIEDVREPALDFINDFAEPLARISPHFVADTRTVGGSLFRIQRDTRFSKDKTPYKTNTGVQFRHVRGKDVHAPGFYLNLEPGACFVGVGIWHPESKVAYSIRTHIDENRGGWKRAAHGKRFSDVFELGGDSLVRAPRGFDEADPLIEDLKRKDFIGSARLTQKEVTSATFMGDFEQRCRAARPFMKFLCDAVGLEF
jgi:uncharacterized protein (TIGR02453 family)